MYNNWDSKYSHTKILILFLMGLVFCSKMIGIDVFVRLTWKSTCIQISLMENWCWLQDLQLHQTWTIRLANPKIKEKLLSHASQTLNLTWVFRFANRALTHDLRHSRRKGEKIFTYVTQSKNVPVDKPF